MKRALLALLLATSALLALATFLTNQPAPLRAIPPEETVDMPPHIELEYKSRANNTTDALRATLHAADAHLAGRVLIEDPSATPAKTLRVVNLTANLPRDIPLRELPALFRVRGVIEKPGAAVLTKWVWQGTAHVIIGNTPADLAQALEAPQ